MAKVIAFVNQKGGVGKTTSCISIGAALSKKGRRVLLIDLDPQGNLSVSLGIRPSLDDATVYEVMKGESPLKDAIIKLEYDVLPSDIRLSGADIEFSSIPGREMILHEILESVSDDYDNILIDCPPSLSIITLNALTSADELVVPVQSEFLALNGVAQLMNTINIVQKRLNPKLELGGVLVTMYDSRKNLHKEVLEKIKEHFPNKVYKTIITPNVTLAEAPGYAKDIFAYKEDSKGAEKYKELCEEMIGRGM